MTALSTLESAAFEIDSRAVATAIVAKSDDDPCEDAEDDGRERGDNDAGGPLPSRGSDVEAFISCFFYLQSALPHIDAHAEHAAHQFRQSRTRLAVEIDSLTLAVP